MLRTTIARSTLIYNEWVWEFQVREIDKFSQLRRLLCMRNILWADQSDFGPKLLGIHSDE